MDNKEPQSHKTVQGPPSTLSDEALRMAVARLCEWEVKDGWLCHKGTRVIPAYGWNKVIMSSANVPNYPVDLNAMHEAEKTLTYGQWIDYVDYLNEHAKSKVGEAHEGYEAIHATARQRAEALVATLEAWPVIEPSHAVGGVSVSAEKKEAL